MVPRSVIMSAHREGSLREFKSRAEYVQEMRETGKGVRLSKVAQPVGLRHNKEGGIALCRANFRNPTQTPLATMSDADAKKWANSLTLQGNLSSL